MANFFAKLKQGLSKTRSNIVDSIESVFTSHDKIDDDFYEELEEILVMGDVGIHATKEILDELKLAVKKRECRKPDECREYLIDVIKEKMRVTESDYEFLDKPSVVMVIGVNGVGKTTTIGKLAYMYKQQGLKVYLGAADTFRAAAVEQLQIWADRVGVPIVRQQMGSDPASVAFDTLSSAIKNQADVVLIDTAGRLHNKVGLMNELTKIKNVMKKLLPDAPDEVLLVLDGSTGQNAFEQARQFSLATEVNSLAVTKLDGTARGGVVIGISHELSIPVKYIGLGEKMTDFQPFDKKAFVDSLFEEKHS